LILHGFARWTFIAVQVLDGPPGLTTRRLSSFLLIPVGTTGRDLHFLARIFRPEFSETPKPDRITRDGGCCCGQVLNTQVLVAPRARDRVSLCLRCITEMKFITKTAMFVAKH
jgi:hypothetical protein